MSEEKVIPGDPELSPSLDVATPYVAQKVTLSIDASKAVDVPTYGANVGFELGSPYQGFVAYPSLSTDVVWQTNDGNKTTWTCPAIVNPNGYDPLSFAGVVSPSQDPNDAKLDSNQQEHNLQNPGIGKPIADPEVMPTVKIFKPATGPQPPTQTGDQQSLISFTFQDGVNPLTQIPAGQFCALFSPTSGTLQDFAFYSGEDVGSATQVTSVNATNTLCAVDTLGTTPPNNTKLNCWIVPATQNDAVIDLQMSLTTEGAPVGIFAIFDYDKATKHPSAYLPFVFSNAAYGGIATFSDTITTLDLHIRPPLYPGALQDGDRVVLVINGQWADNNGDIFVQTWSRRVPGATLWNVMHTDSRLKIGTKKNPEENTFEYIMWRPTDSNPRPILSPKYSFRIGREADLPPYALPPAQDSDYGEPCIVELTSNKGVLNPSDFAKTIHVEVRWSGTNQNGKKSNWTPQDKDLITITFLLNGYDANGNEKNSAPMSMPPHVLDKTTEIDGKQFIRLPVSGYWFEAYGPKPGTQDYPTMQVQYNVTHFGDSPADGINSEIFTGQFNTISAGTGVG